MCQAPSLSPRGVGCTQRTSLSMVPKGLDTQHVPSLLPAGHLRVMPCVHPGRSRSGSPSHQGSSRGFTGIRIHTFFLETSAKRRGQSDPKEPGQHPASHRPVGRHRDASQRVCGPKRVQQQPRAGPWELVP